MINDPLVSNFGYFRRGYYITIHSSKQGLSAGEMVRTHDPLRLETKCLSNCAIQPELTNECAWSTPGVELRVQK